MRIRINIASLIISVFICTAAFAANATVSGDPNSQDQFQPEKPKIPARLFNAADFGCVADAHTLNTEAFKRAVDGVSDAGGGTLVVPAGIYLTGPIQLRSGINLHLEAGATILFTAPKEFFYDGRRMEPLLEARNAHDVEISGSGTINGRGEAWWPTVHDCMHRNSPRPARPHLVVFDTCERVLVEGVVLTHSPMFNLVPRDCQDVTIEGISIYNPAPNYGTDDGIDPAEFKKRMARNFDFEAPNTDGIDPMASQRVLISHCTIDTGDDCIAVKAAEGAITEDIVITDCLFLHGHGCTVGSGSVGGLRNMVVQRCTFRGTEAGVNLESARDRGSALMENIVFRDLTMENVGDAILISDFFPTGARPYRTKAAGNLPEGGHGSPEPVTATTPCWHHISISNVTATCYWEAGMVLGLPEMPINGLLLDNIRIEAPQGLRISYAKNVFIQNVDIHPKHGLPLALYDTDSGVVQ